MPWGWQPRLQAVRSAQQILGVDQPVKRVRQHRSSSTQYLGNAFLRLDVVQKWLGVLFSVLTAGTRQSTPDWTWFQNYGFHLSGDFMIYEDSVMRTLLRSTERTLRPPMAVSVPCMEPNGDESNAYEMVVTDKHLVSLIFPVF